MLHIVAFDVPYPANYGGAIDVFYKIKALHEAGVKITLHCFTYRDRQPNEILNNYCEKNFYYERNLAPHLQFGILPFIVSSRKNNDLLKNLCADDAPILFEGLHTCGFINDARLHNRIKAVRMHNIEWQYYRHLASVEQNFFKKIYFRLESIKLKKFEEKVFFHAEKIFCISHDDEKYFLKKNSEKNFENIFSKKNFKIFFQKKFQKNFSEKKIIFLPPFHSEKKVSSKLGRGNYILYQGDLSVNDNVASVLELIENVFSKLNERCIVAGKNPNNQLSEAINKFDNIQLVANPNAHEMNELIYNAQINILHTRHTSGMKLKLLHALFVGRFCFANTEMISGTGLKNLCSVYNSFAELMEMINTTMELDWQEKDFNKRKEYLEQHFSNEQNARIILDALDEQKSQENL